MALWKDEIFISRYLKEEIEVYDSRMFTYKRRFAVAGLTRLECIVSCSIKECLYILDLKEKAEILRIDPRDGNVIKNWTTNELRGRISVSTDSCIIFNVFNGNVLKEFNCDGNLIRKITLSDAIKVHHAVKLQSGMLVVSCNGSVDKAHTDTGNKVCLLRTDKEESNANFISQICLDQQSAKFPFKSKYPTSSVVLSVDEEKSIIVSDISNGTSSFLKVTSDNQLNLVRVSKDDKCSVVCSDRSVKSGLLTAYLHCISKRTIIEERMVKGGKRCVCPKNKTTESGSATTSSGTNSSGQGLLTPAKPSIHPTSQAVNVSGLTNPAEVDLQDEYDSKV